MTSEMVERVARAMFPHCWAANMEDARRPNGLAQDRDAAREKARAAIIAMREPTIGMRHVSTFRAAEVDWPQMIDAALAEGPTP